MSDAYIVTCDRPLTMQEADNIKRTFREGLADGLAVLGEGAVERVDRDSAWYLANGLERVSDDLLPVAA